MNEQQLKQIWRKEEAIPLKSIDMEYIERYAGDTNNILQKISKKEMIYGGIVSALLIVDFIYSGVFYVVLLSMAIIWAYLIWKNRSDAKADDRSRTENVKDFLINKEKTLKRQIKQQRIFSGVSVFIFVPLMNLLNGTFYERMMSPPKYLITLTITFISVQIFIEFYNRRNYQPILEDLRYLIEQFDEDETRR